GSWLSITISGTTESFRSAPAERLETGLNQCANCPSCGLPVQSFLEVVKGGSCQLLVLGAITDQSLDVRADNVNISHVEGHAVDTTANDGWYASDIGAYARQAK